MLFLVLSMNLLILFKATLSSLVGLFLSARKRLSTIKAVIDTNCNFVYKTCVPVCSFDRKLRGIVVFLPKACNASLVHGRSVENTLTGVRSMNMPTRVLSDVGSSLSYGLCFFSGGLSLVRVSRPAERDPV